MSDFASLNLLLRSLCLDTRWIYAVFWKLKHEEDLTLIYEDGYLNETKSSSKFEDFLYEGLLPSISEWCGEVQDGYSASSPINEAFRSMIYCQYPLKEGIVGKALFTQRHYWVNGDILDPYAPDKYHADWQVQFAAGIKTILLVPIPHIGVIQLASLDMVMEDFEVVGHIKDLFCNFFQVGTSYIREPSMYHANIFSPINIAFPGSSSAPDSDLLFPTNSDQPLNVHPDKRSFVTGSDDFLIPRYLNQIVDTKIAQHPKETLMKISDNHLLVDPFEGVHFPDPWASIISDLQPNSANDRLNPEQLNLHVKGNMPDYYVNDMAYPGVENDVEINSMMTCGLFNYDELDPDKALGQLPLDQSNNVFHTIAGNRVELLSSTTTFQPSWSNMLEQSFEFDEINAQSSEQYDNYMIDAVVKTLHCPSAVNENTIVTLCSDHENLIVSPIANSKSDFSALDLDESLLDKQTNAQGFTFSATSSIRSSCMPNDEESKSSTASRYKAENSSEINKKGGKSNSIHKPRPRDRQLIQDRIKELRELIPNGLKCSIDELLYKTVRHMSFLKSVSAQAEKLSRADFPKVPDEDLSSFESGKKTQRDYPSIVENLDQPGQILIEMLCKDYGLFLEIAHVFRRLDLAILKGVLESRSDVLWAHFIIEVPRGFHKTQILWPLMQLLQKNNTTLKRKL